MERSATPSATTEDLNYFYHPRPFKNPYYDRKSTGSIASKRNKSLKQILVLERERVERVLDDAKRKLNEIKEQQAGGEADADGDVAAEGDVAMDEGDAAAVDAETGVKLTKRGRKRKRDLEFQSSFGQVVSYASVEAPPSLMPPKKYCDVTGLEAKYVDPKSTLRYHNPEIYEVIKSFQPAVIQAYLEVRGQGVVLR
ncbi:hypothetical protein JCM10212_001467 [Sporobolomyces blumeae]